MNFITKILDKKTFSVIDIWSYKVKTLICELKNWEISVLWYWEKRQEITDVIHWEIWNIEWVCNTISDSISKASKQAWINPKDIIINIPSSSITSTSNKINYSRNSPNEEITIDELDYIIWKIESKAISNSLNKLRKTTWYTDVDIKLITSSITQIIIESSRVSNPIWFTWKNITVEVLNIFIPQSKHNTINTIANYLNKNILSIIPLEFSIPKILDRTEYSLQNILFLDIWSTKTRIIVQKQWSIIWFNRMNIWMNDLIKEISSKYNIIWSEVINNINDIKYEKERKEFLEIWIDWVILSLKDILKDDVIPNNIFLSWWWDNKFLRDYLIWLKLSEFGLKTLKNFNFIDVDYEKSLNIKTQEWLKNKTNLNILTLALSWKEIINNTKKPITESLKKIIKKLDI